jgi:hypothetical protein
MSFQIPIRRMNPVWGGTTEQERKVSCNWWNIRVDLEHTDAMVRWNPSHQKAVDALPVGATWFVERSGSTGGPFERIIQGMPVASRAYRDSDIPVETQHVRMLYYVVGYDYVNEEEETVSVRFGLVSPWEKSEEGGIFGISWGEEGRYPSYAPKIVQTIRERIVTMFASRQSEMVYTYRVRWDQPMAPSVVSSRTGSLLYDDPYNSDGSFGTSHVLGYYSPIETLLSTPTMPKASIQEGTQAEMPFWPVPMPTDRIRTLSGHIYEIIEVIPNQQYGFCTHYTVALTELPATDSLATLPLPADHRMMSRFARRQFGRAMNLESYYASQESGTNATASILPPTRGDGSDR